MITDNENDEEDSGLSSTEGDVFESLDLSGELEKLENYMKLPQNEPMFERNDSLEYEDELGAIEILENKNIEDNFKKYSIPPALQYFLASLCDLKIPQIDRKRVGIRYFKTPEVQKLIYTLKRCKLTQLEYFQNDANVIISVLKELLSQFPGGIFKDENEDFIGVSLTSSLKFALIYIQGLIEAQSSFLQNFTYLICKSLKNLAQQSLGSIIDAYTDLLILFTPVLFPHSTSELSRFLRAVRISLILFDLCDIVFKPFLSPNFLDMTADDDFFKDILQTLCLLQKSFHIEESDPKIDPDVDQSPEEMSKSVTSLENSMYYQITYVE